MNCEMDLSNRNQEAIPLSQLKSSSKKTLESVVISKQSETGAGNGHHCHHRHKHHHHHHHGKHHPSCRKHRLRKDPDKDPDAIGTCKEESEEK